MCIHHVRVYHAFYIPAGGQRLGRREGREEEVSERRRGRRNGLWSRSVIRQTEGIRNGNATRGMLCICIWRNQCISHPRDVRMKPPGWSLAFTEHVHTDRGTVGRKLGHAKHTRPGEKGRSRRRTRSISKERERERENDGLSAGRLFFHGFSVRYTLGLA